MFRHVALWKFADDEPGPNREHAIKVKTALEETAYEIHGLVRVDVHIDAVKTSASNADIFMECVFEDRDAFRSFLDSSRYKAVKELLDDVVGERLAMDFEDAPEDDDPGAFI